MTTVLLRPYDPLKQGAVTLFEGYDCTGYSGRFYSPTSFGVKEEYLMWDMWSRNIQNDSATSINIPFGTSVDLFTNDSFGG